MVTWENKPIIIIKDDYDQAKLYFKNLVKDFETHTQNSGVGATKMGYKSTNHMAGVGNEIQKYIQDIASATVVDKERMAELAANIADATKTNNSQLNTITAQIKLLTNTVALLAKSRANKETNNRISNSRQGSNNGGGSNSGERKFKYRCNMGNYCWSHGHHQLVSSTTAEPARTRRTVTKTMPQQKLLGRRQLLAWNQQSQTLTARTPEIQRQDHSQLTGTGAGQYKCRKLQ